MVTKVSFDTSLQTVWNNAYARHATKAPFFDHRWHELWYEVLGKDWQPYPLVIDESIVAPFARKRNEVIFSGGEEISDYQDLIGPDEKKVAAWQQILDFLRVDGVTSVRFRNVPHSSPTIPFFQSLPTATVTQEDTTPIVQLLSSWDKYIESLPYKDRHELRRKMRKMEREHKNILVTESAQPEKDIDQLLDLMQKDKRKAAFLTQEMIQFFKRMAAVFANEISLLTLTMDNSCASATLSFVVNDTYFLYNSGFDKEHCSNAGWYLKAMSMKRAIEKGLKTYNFLQGSERYKYNLGGKEFFVYSIHAPL